MRNKEQMLYDIGMIDFVLVELALYLDTHPYDCNAMEYFNHYNRMKHQLEKDFAARFYPLTMSMSDSNKEWRWGAAPLPWEGVCG